MEKPFSISEPNRAFEHPMLIESYKALTHEYGKRLNREIGLDEIDAELEEIRLKGFEDTLANPRSLVLVARDEHERIVGLLAADFWDEKNEFVKPPYIEIFELMVDESWQNQGVGSALLSKTEEWAATNGVKNITLTAQEFNTGALRLYERMGYKTIHRLLLKRLGETL